MNNLPMISDSARFTPVDSVESPAREQRVLILDDNKPMRDFLASLFSGEGYSVDFAEDGERGWEALCANYYDLLVTDDEMPHLTGLQLIHQVRRSGSILPIILVSASLPDHLSLPLIVTVPKPFDPSELLTTAEKLLFAADEKYTATDYPKTYDLDAY